MINPKNIGICSCIGFFLSFFIGLLSPGVSFSHVILRALIFAAVFAALGVGVSFVYQKFLSNDNGGFVSESDSSAPKTMGNVVNIVVDDSNLPDDGLSPKFTVINNHTAMSETESPASVGDSDSEVPQTSAEPPESANIQNLSEENVSDDGVGSKPDVQAKNESPETASPAEKSTFKPVSLAEPPSAEKLDELPDIGSMNVDSESSGSALDSADEVVSDTEFATGGSKLKEQPISGDTNVMAKAIQTLLAKDNN